MQSSAEGLEGTVQFLSDLCHVQAAQAAGEVSRICAELVFGYNRHPAWDEAEHRSCFLQANSRVRRNHAGHHGHGSRRDCRRWQPSVQSRSMRRLRGIRLSSSACKASSPRA